MGIEIQKLDTTKILRLDASSGYWSGAIFFTGAASRVAHGGRALPLQAGILRAARQRQIDPDSCSAEKLELPGWPWRGVACGSQRRLGLRKLSGPQAAPLRVFPERT